jgi:hypothetical protein
MKYKFFSSTIITLVCIIFLLQVSVCGNLHADTNSGAGFFNGSQPEPVTGVIQRIEGSESGVGTGFSFRFDNESVPSIAYYDLQSCELKYARVERGRWHIVTVAESGKNRDGLTCSLAFDSNNNPSIAYVSQKNNLASATFSDGAWQTETVDDALYTGYYCQLIFDADNQPTVTYQGEEGLMSARKDSDSWHIEVIDNDCNTSGKPVLVDNNLHIYYICTSRLKVAFRNNNQWISSFIPGTENSLTFDVAVNDKGMPLLAVSNGTEIKIFSEHIPGSGIWREEKIGEKKASGISLTYNKVMKSPAIAYLTRDDMGLEVAQKIKDEWVIDDVATARDGYRFGNTSITSDKNGRETVLLHDGDSLLTLVQQREGWGIGRIDGRVRVGGYITSMVFPGGRPAVAYYDYSRQQLRFASLTSENNWNPEIVDALGDVGKFASIAVSSGGVPGIAYHDRTRGDLKYAWKEGKSWKWERVDYSKNVGHYPSLAFDDKDTPNVTYFSPESHKICFAVKQGKEWKKEEPASVRGGGQSVLLIKPSGIPVIFYVDGDKNEGRASLKTAERNNIEKWDISDAAPGISIPLEKNGLSGDISSKGEISVSFISSNSELVIVKKTSAGIHHEKIDSNCLNSTSVKYCSDGTPSILYLKQDAENNLTVNLARHTPEGWIIRQVQLPDKDLNYLSLIKATENYLSFVYENSKDHFATFFKSVEK